MTNFTTDSFASKSINLVAKVSRRTSTIPTARSLTYNVNGEVAGITATRADIAEALGELIQLKINGDWKAGTPVNLKQASDRRQRLQHGSGRDHQRFRLPGRHFCQGFEPRAVLGAGGA